MSVKTTLNYSPNFNKKKRVKNKIKFIILHYTGMKTESAALRRLTDPKSKVSAHYYIKKNGEIITLVPDLYIAWHAGKSKWKNLKSLNKYSIGIEISNPGHGKNYKKFSKRQTISILKLSKHLIKKYKIKPQSILGHSDISPSRKKDPGEKFPWEYLAKNGVGFWHTLSGNLKKKERNKKIDKIEEKHFYKNLFNIGYLNKNSKINKSTSFVIKAFQRRFRQELVNGKLDKECLIISHNLAKKFK